ncbi:MAG: Nif11-like leader peptide family natural product precursor [Alphaproteobacteria bacterium]|nr:Nif11-like leader peptide family natural product precursor [Alphaproteobacteria bacterium]
MTSQAYEQLKTLVASTPALKEKLSSVKEVGDAAELLAVIAAENGIAITAEQIKQQIAAGSEGRPNDELDDAALEAVSGGGSPWCWMTDGCYCFFTK